MSIWDNKEQLAKQEEQRKLLRESGKRLTFDCFSLRLKGDRVYCSKGQRLGQAKDGGLVLVAVLRGVCSGACKNCKWFDTEE